MENTDYQILKNKILLQPTAYKEFDKNEIYIKMQLVDNENDSILAERIQYLVYPKDLK